MSYAAGCPPEAAGANEWPIRSEALARGQEELSTVPGLLDLSGTRQADQFAPTP